LHNDNDDEDDTAIETARFFIRNRPDLKVTGPPANITMTAEEAH
jgi:hypothetical protein